MPNTFLLTIASVGETRFSGEAESVTLPGAEGVFEILAHHEPLVTTLKKGAIVVKAGGESRTYDIESGVAECSGNRAVVLL